MPTTYRGFRFVAIGLVLVLFDIKISALDFLPDPLGYALVSFGLVGMARFHPAFRIAMLAAAALGLNELYTFFLPLPAVAPTPGIGGLPPFDNEPFHVNWSTRGSIFSVIDTVYTIALAHGLYVFFAQRGDVQNSDTALLRRNQFVYVALLGSVAVVTALAILNIGVILLLLTAVIEFVYMLSLIRLLVRAARPPRPDMLLAHLVAPVRVPTRGLLDWWRYTPFIGRWLFSVAACVYVIVIWRNMTPCSPIDTLVRKSGCVVLIDQHQGLMTGLSFAPDNRSVVTNSAGHVRWNALPSGHTERQWNDRGRSFAHFVAMSPDGTIVAAAQRDGIRLWRAGTSIAHVPINVNRDYEGMIAFASDGASFAAADDDGKVHIWRTTDGTLVHSFAGAGRHSQLLRFSNRGTLVAASGNRIAEWRVDDGTVVQMVELPQFDTVTALSADGAIFVVVSNGAIELRSMRTGELMRRLNHTIGDTRAQMVLSHDGAHLAVWYSVDWQSDSDTIAVYRTADGVQVGTLPVPGSSTYGISEIRFSPDDRLLAASGIASGRGMNNVAVWRVP